MPNHDVFIVQVMRRETVKQISGSHADVRLSKSIETAYQNTPGVTEANEKTVDQQVHVTGQGTQLDGKSGT